jgi:YHS domain-containing protein
MKGNLLTILFILAGQAIFSQDQAGLRKKQFNLEEGVGIKGYDPVAYFTEGKAVKGNKDEAALSNGVTYYFSSGANRQEFRKNPSRYEPQYGGWCAYAMGSSGSKVEIDPGTFKIQDGKLYLFYNKFFNNTLKSWNKDETKLQKNANANWLKFYH